MRGIAGLIHLEGKSVSIAQITHLIRSMASAPADKITWWQGGSAGLAHLLRKSVPEDEFENQPLIADDGSIVVTDALLTNRAELITAFGWSGAEAVTRPDSAFVLAAWIRWKEECPRHLDGRYAFAIWQPAEKRLFCAVDPLGFRPFYYWQDKSTFAFATTLKGLFSLPEIPRQLNDVFFAEQFVGLRRISSDTLHLGVSRIMRGHTLQVEPGRTSTFRYWNPDPQKVLKLKSDRDYTEAFYAEFERAVRSTLRGTGNIGIMLSGGLDSSAVAAVAGKLLAEQGRRLQAFHFVPPTASRYHAPLRELDESPFVRAFQAQAPHIDFHFLTANPEPLPLEDWDAFFAENFVPFRTLPEVHGTTRTGSLAKYNLSGLLNGLGGNWLVSLESFSSSYMQHLALSRRWYTLAREVLGHHHVYGRSLRQLLRHALIEPGLKPSHPNQDMLAGLLHPDLLARTGLEERRKELNIQNQRNLLKFRHDREYILSTIAAQQMGTPPSVFGQQNPDMIFGPMFDRRLNEFCLSLPFSMQIRQGWDRRILREAMRGRLPEDVRLRVSRGFPQPQFQLHFAKLKAELFAQIENLNSQFPVNQYFAIDKLKSITQNTVSLHSNGNAEMTLAKIVIWLSFIKWHQKAPLAPAKI